MSSPFTHSALLIGRMSCRSQIGGLKPSHRSLSRLGKNYSAGLFDSFKLVHIRAFLPYKIAKLLVRGRRKDGHRPLH